ncbi:MAG TPA: LysM peptidoglycan-binding domain-containing M23 family metallopeptidase, partial [Xanthobacteraceae bacterium]|nr:LysM peptidoglycan-binding domain-containing M23 family metallopeptidase [Xanthobacteraceae bacterium]
IPAFPMPSSRSVRLLSAGMAALALAACGSDVTRFNGDANGNPYRAQSNDVTYSSGGHSGAPVAQVESRPLDQPAYNSGGTPVYGPKVYGQNSAPQYHPQQQPYGQAPQYQPQQPRYQQQSYTPRSVPAAPAPAYTPASEATGSIGHKTTVTLKRGETIHTLAKRYGVSTAAILRENNFADANRVRPGTRIVIPARTERAHVSPSHGSTHIVASGETLYSLSRRYHVSHTQIAQANGISASAPLRIGQHLTIPGRTVASTPAHRAEPAPKKVASINNTPVDNVASVKPVEPVEPQSTKSASAANGTPSFRWPVKGRVISAYGKKPNGQQNDGINISVPENTAVKASEDGTVAYAGNELKGYGNLVLIRHAGGYVTAYAHNSEILVHRGEKVTRGQVIAKAGQTGGVAAPQVHFEIRKGSNPVDPARYLTSL